MTVLGPRGRTPCRDRVHGRRLPLVVTDCGALRDMVTDGQEGFLVPVGDVVVLADRISRFASDPSLRSDMGVRADSAQSGRGTSR